MITILCEISVVKGSYNNIDNYASLNLLHPVKLWSSNLATFVFMYNIKSLNVNNGRTLFP